MVIVDIGCGDGGWLLRSAASNPANDYIGLELISALVAKASARAPNNALFLAGDAVAWLEQREESSVDEVHVYHPQPYYDPAEVQFGMLTAVFFERLWRVLKPGGRLLFQTDNRRYGRYLLEAARRRFDADVQKGPWPDGPRTRRESIAIGKRLRILRVVAVRRATPIEADPPAPYFDLTKPGLRRRRQK
ncbi:MAG TPA: methyltransferase domain-containing protein [Planctomycetota bacterium]|nr:methyltransferase domain-containing protein [Planctomycetota bacterium]